MPDPRLDQLTALFNPKKHTPATVEFADMGGAAAGKTGAAALLDVAPFRNADALLHVVRMFRDPSVPHAAGSDRSRRATCARWKTSSSSRTSASSSGASSGSSAI